MNAIGKTFHCWEEICVALVQPLFLCDALRCRDAARGGAGMLCGDGSKQGLGGMAAPSSWLT